MFTGCSSLQSLTLEEGVSEFSVRAVWGCKNLVSLTIPKSVTKFDTSGAAGPGAEVNLLTGCPNVELSCYEGSEAALYAEEYGIPFHLL